MQVLAYPWRGAEIFGYLMEGCIVLVLCALAVRARQPLYFVWATLFLYILLDDSLMLHQRVVGPSALAFLGLSREDMVLGINARDLCRGCGDDSPCSGDLEHHARRLPFR